MEHDIRSELEKERLEEVAEGNDFVTREQQRAARLSCELVHSMRVMAAEGFSTMVNGYQITVRRAQSLRRAERLNRRVVREGWGSFRPYLGRP
ncbi:MAG: hypothetical protein JWN73_1727 [Betaproteobacteria bacterium]|nr:hypothetical protein [Betaproteobacteria bacterium]